MATTSTSTSTTSKGIRHHAEDLRPWGRSVVDPHYVFIHGMNSCQYCAFDAFDSGVNGELCGAHSCHDGAWVHETEAMVVRLIGLPEYKKQIERK